MKNVLRDAAIENNVFWCDTVIRTHQLRTQMTADSWLHYGKSVPFYPRFITRASSLLEEQVESELAKLGPASEITIKDSHADLNLDHRAFEVLFESRWIALRVDSPVRSDEKSEGEWNKISTIREFQEWCSHWARYSNGKEEFARDLFKTELLENPKVSFLRRASKGSVVGIAITFESANTIGISNFTGDEGHRESNWSSLARYLQKNHAQSVLVGYENGAELESAEKTGFQAVGSLRVWKVKEQTRT